MTIFVYSVQMSRLSTYILFFSLFLLAACDSAKKEFMTPKQGEIVIDVNTEEYSLNGDVIGKTDSDISAIDDLLIKPIDNELKKKREFEQGDALKNSQPSDEFGLGKLHVDENLSYGDFFKVIITMGFIGYSTILYAIGENFKDVYNVKLPTRSSPCYCTFFTHRHVPLLRYKHGRNRSKLLLNEILSADNHQRETEIECFKDYKSLDLLLTLYGSKDDMTYVVSLNEDALKENSSFHGFNFYSFKNEADLWKFIADVHSRVESRNRNNPEKDEGCAQDLSGKQVMLMFKKDVLMKDVAPLIKGLNAFGYNGDRITFSVAR